ncbi:hypothetical protein pb186bvf_009571 [Paramecium bursaria]
MIYMNHQIKYLNRGKILSIYYKTQGNKQFFNNAKTFVIQQ